MDDRKLNKFLIAAIVLSMAVAFAFVAVVRADWPSLPSESKGWPDLPAATHPDELPVPDAKPVPPLKPVKRNWVVIATRPGPCASCPSQDVYGWKCENEDGSELTPDQAAVELAIGDLADEEIARLKGIIKVGNVLDKFQHNTLTKEEVDDLKATVPGEIIKKVMRQRWSTGSCGMACRSGGSLLYNVYDDGTEEVAPIQPDVAPEEGVHGGGGFRFRLFRGRR